MISSYYSFTESQRSLTSFKRKPVEADNEEKEYVTRCTWLAGICGAFAGFSYGYEPPIVSGLVVINSFVDMFWAGDASAGNPKSQSPYCNTTSLLLTFYIACCFITAAIGSPVSALIINKIGRRSLFLCGAWVLLFANVLQIAATNQAMLWVGRLMLGLCVGINTVVAPIYVAEMSPAHCRGRFGALFGVSAATGQAVGYFVNLGVGAWNSPQAWRLSFAAGTWSTLGMLILLHFFLPDTPSSLLQRNRPELAHSVFLRIRSPHPDNEDEWQSIQDEIFQNQESSSGLHKNIVEPLLDWHKLSMVFKDIPALTIMLHLGVVRMWSGFLATMFFTSIIFKAAGSSSFFSLLAQSLVGIFTVIGSIGSILTIDKIGRRKLLVRSGTVMSVCLGIAAVLLGVYLKPVPGSTMSTGAATGLLISLVGFQLFFWSSWGPSFWVVLSEVYPLEARGTSIGVGMTISQLAVFVVLLTNSEMLCTLEYGTFILFACISAYLTTFAHFMLPETKGLQLQQIHEQWKRHPVWKNWQPTYDKPT